MMTKLKEQWPKLKNNTFSNFRGTLMVAISLTHIYLVHFQDILLNAEK